MNSQSTKEVAVVRNYKDTLFRLIFQEKERLLNLYNAINETSYSNPEDLEIITLENAIYLNMKNDIAFILDLEVNLYEHQATYNPNMPIRNLFYIAKEFEKLTRNQSLYLSKKMMIPTPKFIVFYNGVAEQPEQQILKLSDSFLKPMEQPALELKVLMININKGKNTKLLDLCKTLKEYTLYVEKVRKYSKEMKLEDAVEKAVTESIKENILEDTLRKYRSEVIAMSIFEYDEEREMKLLRAGEREIGKLEGKQNILLLIEKMSADGLDGQIYRLSKDEVFLEEMLQKYK